MFLFDDVDFVSDAKLACRRPLVLSAVRIFVYNFGRNTDLSGRAFAADLGKAAASMRYLADGLYVPNSGPCFADAAFWRTAMDAIFWWRRRLRRSANAFYFGSLFAMKGCSGGGRLVRGAWWRSSQQTLPLSALAKL